MKGHVVSVNRQESRVWKESRDLKERKTVFSAFLTGLLIQQAAVWYSYLSLIPAAHNTVWKIIWSIEAYILEINSVIRKQ